MRYNLKQYQKLAERFNNMSFLQKIIVVKQQSLFILECDIHGNLSLRLDDFEAMQSGVDILFTFPENLNGKEIKDVFSLIDLKVKIV